MDHWGKSVYCRSVVIKNVMAHTLWVLGPISIYRKVSNVRRTKSQNLNDSRLVLKLFLPNSLKLGVKSRMKM